MKTESLHDIDGLEKKLIEIEERINLLSKFGLTKKLIIEIRRPGWTKPAEYLLVRSALDKSLDSLKGLEKLHKQVLKAGQMISRG